MKFEIVRVNNSNYDLFDDMIFWRMNKRERTKEERQSNKISSENLSELENPNLYLYSAVIDDKMVGWISIIYLPKVGKYNGRGLLYIDELWVEPTYRGFGIGKALLEKSKDLFNKLDVSNVRLFVESNNIIAQKLYKSIGFDEKSSCIMMETNF